MNKKISLSSLTLLLFSIPSVAIASVSATSEFSVFFDTRETPQVEPPVSPVDPTVPITPNPDDPTPPSTDGLLSIDYVSYIQFGKKKAQGSDMLYSSELNKVITSENQTIEVPNFIQVTDNRGLNSGWQLLVEQPSPFKNGESDLIGTELTFKNPNLSTKTSESNFSPTTSDKFQLSPGSGAEVVMTSAEEQGMGTWLARFGQNNEQGQESILLNVPGKSPKKSGFYSTSLIWTLVDTPLK